VRFWWFLSSPPAAYRATHSPYVAAISRFESLSSSCFQRSVVRSANLVGAAYPTLRHDPCGCPSLFFLCFLPPCGHFSRTFPILFEEVIPIGPSSFFRSFRTVGSPRFPPFRPGNRVREYSRQAAGGCMPQGLRKNLLLHRVAFRACVPPSTCRQRIDSPFRHVVLLGRLHPSYGANPCFLPSVSTLVLLVTLCFSSSRSPNFPLAR